MPNQILTTILWLQLLIGCGVSLLSWGPMFGGAMGTEWTSKLKKELESIQGSANYQEPPKIGGMSYADIVEALQRTTYESMHLAGYLFVGGLGLAITSAVELWLVYRLKQHLASPRHEYKAG